MYWMYPLSSLRCLLQPWAEWLFLIYVLTILFIMLTCSIPPIIDLKRLKRRLWQRKGIERRRSRVMTAPNKEDLK